MLGKNVIVRGEIRSQEDLRIEGEVEGTIEMKDGRLTIAANGKVRATVKAREIRILGSIQGSIEAVEKVYIGNSAHFEGDIQTGGIIVEDGGYIRGNVELSRRPACAQNAGTDQPSLDQLPHTMSDASNPASNHL